MRDDHRVSPLKLKTEFSNIADACLALAGQLRHLSEFVVYECDANAIEHIITDLHWATENCTVIGNHLLHKNLNDNMGHGPVRRIRRDRS